MKTEFHVVIFHGSDIEQDLPALAYYRLAGAIRFTSPNQFSTVNGTPRAAREPTTNNGPIRPLGEVHLVVAVERERRKVDGGIEVLPWKRFLEMLWSGEFRV